MTERLLNLQKKKKKFFKCKPRIFALKSPEQLIPGEQRKAHVQLYPWDVPSSPLQPFSVPAAPLTSPAVPGISVLPYSWVQVSHF